MSYIIRDHDMDKFTRKKDVLKEVVKFLNYKYGGDIVQLEIEDSYYNMKEKNCPCYGNC